MDRVGIVLADDQKVFRIAVRDYLERDPEFRVLAEAENGADALVCVRLNLPEILLLEMRLPSPDGVEVLKAIRAEKLPVKVLAFSAFSDERYIRAAIEQGGSGYLLKNEEPETLLRVLKRISQGEKNFFSEEVYTMIQYLGYALENNLT